MSGVPSTFQNRILAQLNPRDLKLLGPLEPLQLPLRAVLESSDTAIEFVYFLEVGLGSVVASVPRTAKSIEVGIIGSEGMTGLSIVYGSMTTPFDTYMQVAGSGFRVPASVLKRATGESAAMRELFLRYAHAFAIQVASTAVANGRSLLEERLARWLLMVGDRMGNSFSITHEFLALMLAVRRPGVTLAVQNLEGRGLIRASRGSIAILDRHGLISASEGAYGLPEREYDRLLAATG